MSEDDITKKEQEVADLASAIHSPGWQKIIKPSIEALRFGLLNALVFGGAKDNNGKPVNDEELKARIKNANWMLEWEVKLVDWSKDLEEQKAALAAPAEEEEGIGTIHDPRVQLT